MSAPASYGHQMPRDGVKRLFSNAQEARPPWERWGMRARGESSQNGLLDLTQGLAMWSHIYIIAFILALIFIGYLFVIRQQS
jgi:hypothetical protein